MLNKESYRSLGTTIIAGAVSSLVAMAIYLCIELFWGASLTAPQQTLIVGLIVIIFVVPITMAILSYADKELKKRYMPLIIDEIRPGITMDVKHDFEAKTGIVEIYQNFDACEHEILEVLKQSKDCKIFLQIGKSLLSGTTDLYNYISKNNIKKGAMIKILHAGKTNPFLTAEIATDRGSNHDEWVQQVNHASKMAAILKNKDYADIEAFTHKEGFVWRLFIFEKAAYVQPYLYSSNNSEMAPVYKITKDLSTSNGVVNPKSLYITFSRYFDNKWSYYKKT